MGIVGRQSITTAVWRGTDEGINKLRRTYQNQTSTETIRISFNVQSTESPGSGGIERQELGEVKNKKGMTPISNSRLDIVCNLPSRRRWW